MLGVREPMLGARQFMKQNRFRTNSASGLSLTLLFCKMDIYPLLAGTKKAKMMSVKACGREGRTEDQKYTGEGSLHQRRL